MRSTTIAAVADVVMSTVDRPKNYVHKSISSLPKTLPLRLMVGSPSYEYLSRYRDDPRIEIVGVHPPDWERFRDYSVRHRASWNYWRCLAFGARADTRKKGLLVLEDDVIPAKGWQRRLLDTIFEIESKYGNEYVLSLYTAYDGLNTFNAQGALYTRFPVRVFFGTQAVFFPSATLSAV